jgi:hypothetical protein
LTFVVDVTADIRALLEDGAPAAGVVWRTMDTPTGTSIDNLGDGAAGPPGVDGSFMPFLTVELAAAATSTPTPTATPVADTPTTAPDTPTVVLDTPTPTATHDPGSTATPTLPPGACAGDCNGDDAVTVNELVTAVTMALGNAAACAAVDGDGDGTVSISELVRAIGALLNGC